MPCDADRSKILSEATAAAVEQCTTWRHSSEVNAAIVDIVGEVIAHTLPRLEASIRADIYAEVVAKLDRVATMPHEVCAMSIQLNHQIERWRLVHMEPARPERRGKGPAALAWLDPQGASAPRPTLLGLGHAAKNLGRTVGGAEQLEFTIFQTTIIQLVKRPPGIFEGHPIKAAIIEDIAVERHPIIGSKGLILVLHPPPFRLLG